MSTKKTKKTKKMAQHQNRGLTKKRKKLEKHSKIGYSVVAEQTEWRDSSATTGYSKNNGIARRNKFSFRRKSV